MKYRVMICMLLCASISSLYPAVQWHVDGSKVLSITCPCGLGISTVPPAFSCFFTSHRKVVQHGILFNTYETSCTPLSCERDGEGHLVKGRPFIFVDSSHRKHVMRWVRNSAQLYTRATRFVSKAVLAHGVGICLEAYLLSLLQDDASRATSVLAGVVGLGLALGASYTLYMTYCNPLKEALLFWKHTEVVAEDLTKQIKYALEKSDIPHKADILPTVAEFAGTTSSYELIESPALNLCFTAQGYDTAGMRRCMLCNQLRHSGHAIPLFFAIGDDPSYSIAIVYPASYHPNMQLPKPVDVVVEVR